MAGERFRLQESMRWPEPRLKSMDEHRVSRAMVYPTLADLVEFHVADDPDLTHDVLHTLNEWMHEVWSFNLGDRVYPAAGHQLHAGRPGHRRAGVGRGQAGAR